MTDEGERIKLLEREVTTLQERVKHLETSERSALVGSLILLGSGFLALLGILMRKSGIFIALVSLLFAAVFGVSYAFAHHEDPQNCAPRAVIVKQLMMRYGERAQNIHTRNGRALLEFWANPQTGTWTMLRSRLGGIACMVGHGQRKPQGKRKGKDS